MKCFHGIGHCWLKERGAQWGLKGKDDRIDSLLLVITTRDHASDNASCYQEEILNLEKEQMLA